MRNVFYLHEPVFFTSGGETNPEGQLLLSRRTLQVDHAHSFGTLLFTIAMYLLNRIQISYKKRKSWVKSNQAYVFYNYKIIHLEFYEEQNHSCLP